MNKDYLDQIKEHKADCLLSHGYTEDGANQIVNGELPTEASDRALIGAWFDDKHLTGEQKKEMLDSADPRVYDGGRNPKNIEESSPETTENSSTGNNAK